MATRPAFPIRKSPADIVRDAAPDLLAAASESLDFIEAIESRSGVETSAGNMLRAAIAKARGQV